MRKVKSGDEMVRKANEQKKTEQTFVRSLSADILSFPGGWSCVKLGKKTSWNFLIPLVKDLRLKRLVNDDN